MLIVISWWVREWVTIFNGPYLKDGHMVTLLIVRRRSTALIFQSRCRWCSRTAVPVR